MLSLIIYIIAVLCMIVAIVLLTFIPNKAVRVFTLILVMLLFIGGMSFVIYKVSGQQSFFDTFDDLTSPANRNRLISDDINVILTNNDMSDNLDNTFDGN